MKFLVEIPDNKKNLTILAGYYKDEQEIARTIRAEVLRLIPHFEYVTVTPVEEPK
jgi:hypothetical protein